MRGSGWGSKALVIRNKKDRLNALGIIKRKYMESMFSKGKNLKEKVHTVRSGMMHQDMIPLNMLPRQVQFL